MNEKNKTMLRPMPLKFGVGFMAENPLPEDMVRGYRYEHTGRYHNYHVTKERWRWPPSMPPCDDFSKYIVDGFSPNLNKELHVGHLRNLAIANSLSKMLENYRPRFVALLGASLGVTKAALEGWKWWTQFVGYRPEAYYDVILPNDIIDTHPPTVRKEGFLAELEEMEDPPFVWDGPKGEVIVKRADERPLYAYYDLAFAKEVGPTHYITGHEQREHFANLGLEDKHLPMGLVLGEDGKKIKSRSGAALSATEALSMISHHLRETPNERSIAWNIAAWNFLHAARETNLKFEAEKWIKPEAPGMYITYTYARVISALEKPPIGSSEFDGPETEEDIQLLGTAEQVHYYRYKACHMMDPAPIANFAHELARAIGNAYERERIRDGRPSFHYTISHATLRLQQCMRDLGMFLVHEV